MATARAWMSSWCFFFYLFVAVSAILRAESSSATSDEFVLTLDSSNFSQTISKHPFIVVEFYAPWCGHCMKLAPEYEKAASVLSNHDPSIILAKVDANDELNKELASKYGVKGYPTVKILRDGGRTVQEYKGPRNADGIVEYLKKQVGPASAEIKSLEDVGNLINDKKIVIVGVFSEFSGEEFQNFLTLAEKLRSDHDFCHTLDAELLPRGGSAVNKPVIRLFKPFDELFVDFQDFHVDAMEKFIEEASVPTVTIFNNDPSNEPYLAKFFNNANVQVMLFLNFRSEYYVAFESKYHDVAQHYKGKNLSFLLGDTEATKRAFQFFGLKDDQEPLIIIHNSGGQKYLKQNLEPDHIAPWLKEYMEGKVKPFIKSEPIPEVNNDPVKNVVADNIHDAVLNSRKNVLLEIYAPWCGHCKKLAPILDEVAVSFKSDSDVIIAKIDGTANDIPTDTFDVKGYPALYFSSANGKVVPYDGNMTKEDIIEFILKNRDAVIQPNSMKDEL